MYPQKRSFLGTLEKNKKPHSFSKHDWKRDASLLSLLCRFYDHDHAIGGMGMIRFVLFFAILVLGEEAYANCSAVPASIKNAYASAYILP